MKRAFLILAPEGSGNRMWVRLLMAAGCRGRGEYAQEFDWPGRVNLFKPPEGYAGPIVWFRSVPHRNEWADASAMAGNVRAAGWEPCFLLPIRDAYCTKRSQTARGWDHGDVETQLRKCWESVFFSGYCWRWCVYESLIHGGLPSANAVLRSLDLKPLQALPFGFHDGNVKHFARQGVEPCTSSAK